MANSYRRFPRSKYVHQVERIQWELAAWRAHFRDEAKRSDSPTFQALLLTRAEHLDEWWHELDKSRLVLSHPARWPR